MQITEIYEISGVVKIKGKIIKYKILGGRWIEEREMITLITSSNKKLYVNNLVINGEFIMVRLKVKNGVIEAICPRTNTERLHTLPEYENGVIIHSSILKY